LSCLSFLIFHLTASPSEFDLSFTPLSRPLGVPRTIFQDNINKQGPPTLALQRKPSSAHLKGIVLRRNLLDPVVTNDGDSLHDVYADPGNVAEEKDCEDAGRDAEAGRQPTVAQGFAY